jgi:hypothetical protein
VVAAFLQVLIFIVVVFEGEDRVGVLRHLCLDVTGLGSVAGLDEPPVREKKKTISIMIMMMTNGESA